jgi:tRNA dimethylallyltransferase
LNIGVAKPITDQLKTVPHFFINTHSLHEEVNAGIFEQYALDTVAKILKANDIAIMAGGTGLYIKAFCEGMDEMPPVSISTREMILSNFNKSGIEWLQQEVQEKDPLYYKTGEVLNPQRLMRALEVKLISGRSIREFQQGKKLERDFDIIRIGLELSKEELDRNINHRVDDMIVAGLVEEAKSLYEYRHLNALQTVGYSEMFNYIEQQLSLEETISLIKKNTRRYAKRQITWFRKDQDIKWMSPLDLNEIMKFLNNSL